jgi:hypothetical protein
MMSASIGDVTSGFVAVAVSLVVLLVLSNALPGRYFRWRVSKEPAKLDAFTQAEFDWCWNLTTLVAVSHVYGLLWALDALGLTPGIMLLEFVNDNWIAPVALLVAYIALFVHTGRPRPSTHAMIAYAAILVVAAGLGFVVSAGILRTVDPAVLASVYDSNSPIRPDEMISIYAVMGFFFAPDFLLYVFLVNMVPLAVGYVVCQLIDAIIKLLKKSIHHTSDDAWAKPEPSCSSRSRTSSRLSAASRPS